MAAEPMTILHVDMDAFYAAVEQRDRPELRGRPVIVGGIGGRGVVSAASYEARPFGVHSAMPMGQARRLCPHGVFLPVRMSHYAAISRQIREIFFSFSPLVEPLSLDEAFLDVGGSTLLFGPAPAIARQIKAWIKAETGLNASVGVAANKFLAKLACDIGKPDGLTVVPPEMVAEFLAPLPVSRIWGVGAKGEKRLHSLGIRTIGQLAAMPEPTLVANFGEVGRHIGLLARGIDDRTVVPDRAARSISTETTFAADIADRRVLRVQLLALAEHLASRLRHAGLFARTIDLKFRASDFRTWTRAQSLTAPTQQTSILWKAAADLFERSLLSDMLPLRLLGIGATRLTREPVAQGDLFDTGSTGERGGLDATIDAIRGKFGTNAIRRGSLLNPDPSDPGPNAGDW